MICEHGGTFKYIFKLKATDKTVNDAERVDEWFKIAANQSNQIAIKTDRGIATHKFSDLLLPYKS